PTACPFCLRARARFTATVDLPTPPLPDETATVCLTSGMSAAAEGPGRGVSAMESVSSERDRTVGNLERSIGSAPRARQGRGQAHCAPTPKRSKKTAANVYQETGVSARRIPPRAQSLLRGRPRPPREGQ